VDQVRVQANGQLVLVEMPGVTDRDAQRRDGADPRQAVDLLGAVAVLLLEGRPRSGGDAPRLPLRAPVPEHARRLVHKLLAGPPAGYRNIHQFQADLAATREESVAGSRPRRAAHLAIQTAFLALGLAMMSVGGCMSSIMPASFDLAQTLVMEQAHDDLHAGAWREFFVQGLGPVRTAQLAALVQLDADLRLDQHLAAKQRRVADRQKARLRSLSPPAQQYLLLSLHEAQPQIKAMLDRRRTGPKWWLVDFRSLPWTRSADDMLSIERFLRNFFLGVVAFWPAVWVVWAFLTRGGLSFRLAGLMLVRDDGSRAARWQCAWRALLVWGPVAGLLLFSLWLDAWHWSTWDASQPRHWVAWLTVSAWWAGWALLPIYVFLALRQPGRALHDRLAGTYVVPR
jgi:hypothetical protein